MARLREHGSSQTPTLGDAATQQLRTRSDASQAPPAPSSSAVVGASLLNAARSGKPETGAVKGKPKAGAGKGKLPRPSTLSGIPSKKPAGRSDLYDPLGSPVEGGFQLPEIVNPAPLKVLRKNKRPKGDAAAPSEAHAEQHGSRSEPDPAAEDGDEQRISTSPPVSAKDNASPAASSEHRRLITPDSGDRSAPNPASLPNEAASRTTQSKRKFEAEIDQRNRRSDPPKLHGPDASELPNRKKLSLDSSNQGRSGRTGRRSHPEVRIPVRIPVRRVSLSTSSLRADAGHDLLPGNQQRHDADTIVLAVREPSTAGSQRKLRHQATQVSALASGSSRSTSSGQARTTSTPKSQEDVAETITHSVPVLGDGEDDQQVGDHVTSSDDQDLDIIQAEKDDDYVEEAVGHEEESETDEAVGHEEEIEIDDAVRHEEEIETDEAVRREEEIETDDAVRREEEIETDDAVRHDEEIETDEAVRHEEEIETDEAVRHEEEVETDEASEKIATLTHLDQVFKFLDSEERPGKCQTNLAVTIKRICHKSCAAVSGENDSFDVVIKNTDNVRAVLGGIDNLGEPEKSAFKTDAYSYLFRSIILYLETVFGWLSEKYDEVKESLIAMQILYPLVKDTLAFKDKMATWKVSVPQRPKGDGLIKNVESELIVPLRGVEQEFRIRLSNLEAADKRCQMRLELKCKQEEEAARQVYLAARKERRKHWQDLHIARMQCEPDPLRRRKLFFTELDDIEETDANGVKFERVPLFKDRVTPRPTSSGSEQKEWADEQTTVLIKALEKFAGPGVFERLFHAHCRPGGMLRDFTVTDITAKAAWVRSAYLKFHQVQQDKGWEVPDWVKQIPVLP